MGRFSHRCKCQDGRRAGRWVVLKPPVAPGKYARLKCLACGWKFSKRNKYVATLPRHVEDTRSGMSDQDVLARIEAGTLVVDTDRATVFSVSRYGGTFLRVIERESSGSTYHFVEITSAGKKKKIALHRLVWIAAHRELPPPGFDVNHKRGKRVPLPDSIDNLELLPSSVNRRLGAPSPDQLEFAF